MSKAFDSISHDLFLKKLPSLGIDSDPISWITSYLTNRTQKTKFEHFNSDSAKIQSGLPQGYILGPLLFLCYTNDLIEAFENTCKMLSYAVDTQLIITSETKEELKNKLELSMSKAQKWYNNKGSFKYYVTLCGGRGGSAEF